MSARSQLTTSELQFGSWDGSTLTNGAGMAISSDQLQLKTTTGIIKLLDLDAGSETSNAVKIDNIATPTDDAHAANKAYVDSLSQGLQVAASVKAVASSNSSLHGCVRRLEPCSRF